MRLAQRIEQKLFSILVSVGRGIVFILESFIDIKDKGFLRSLVRFITRIISRIFEGLALFLEQFKSPSLKYLICICWKLEHSARYFERYLFPLLKEPEYDHPFLLVRKYLFLKRKFRELYLSLKNTCCKINDL